MRDTSLIYKDKICQGFEGDSGGTMRFRVDEILKEDPWIGKPSYSLIGELGNTGLRLAYISKFLSSPNSIYVYATDQYQTGRRSFGNFERR